MNLKKVFALLMCAALLLCVVGCGKEPAPNNNPTGDDALEAGGVLFVSVGAEFKVVFDTEGLVIAVDPLNGTAADVLSSYDTYTGADTKTVVSELVKQTIAGENNGESRVVVLKQAPGGQVPSKKFLEEVRQAAVAVTDFEVMLIEAKDLADGGYVTPDAAKDILTRQLKLTNVTMSHSEVVDDCYTITFELDGSELEYKVNAATGTVIIQRFSDIGPDFDPTMEGDLEFEGYVPDPDMENDDYYGGPQEAD